MKYSQRLVDEIKDARRKGEFVIDIAAWSGMSTSFVSKVTQDIASPKKSKKGRPRAFDHEAALRAKKLGATNQQLADRFGVKLSTIQNMLWRRTGRCS